MPVHVRVDGGIIMATISGDQTYSDLEALGDALASYAKDGTIDKLLLDETSIGSADSGARRAAGMVARRFYFNRVALVGANQFMRILVKLIANTTDHVDVLKFFNSRAQAVRWLLHETR